MVKNFYIFRHGQSSYNLEGKIQGHSNNSVLTDTGIDQAYNAANILKNKNIELIVSSPLRRARQTSMILSKVLHTNVHFDDKLTEANLGILEGMYRKDAKKEFEDTYAKWYDNNPQNVDVSFKEGESKKQIIERVFNTLNRYADSPYQNIAISGHKTTISQVLMSLGIEAPELPNGSIVHLQLDKGKWKYIGTLQ